MRGAAEPKARDLLQSIQPRRSAEAAEKAAARLLAGLEQSAGMPVDLAASRDALRRHGDTLRRIGGVPLLRLAFDRLCNAAPAQASSRFNALAAVWGPLLSTRSQP